MARHTQYHSMPLAKQLQIQNSRRPCCSVHCQNVPHSLSYVLGVQVVAPRQGHHTNLGHLMGTLGTSGIGGGGGFQ